MFCIRLAKTLHFLNQQEIFLPRWLATSFLLRGVERKNTLLFFNGRNLKNSQGYLYNQIVNSYIIINRCPPSQLQLSRAI